MWRINVVNVGIGTTRLRASSKPANAAQAMKSAARILQSAIPLRGVEKLLPAQHGGGRCPERAFAFAGCRKAFSRLVVA
jgi:hypothetical protein